MTLVKSMFVGIVLLAAAEMAVFAAVASETGIGVALALVVASSLGGVLVLKQAGRVQIEKLRRAMAERTAIAVESADLMLVLAGILLLVPGFVTDLVGLVLLVPRLRRWIALVSLGAIERRRGRPHDSVIELERDEWRRLPDDNIEDQRRRR